MIQKKKSLELQVQNTSRVQKDGDKLDELAGIVAATKLTTSVMTNATRNRRCDRIRSAPFTSSVQALSPQRLHLSTTGHAITLVESRR